MSVEALSAACAARFKGGLCYVVSEIDPLLGVERKGWRHPDHMFCDYYSDDDVGALLAGGLVVITDDRVLPTDAGLVKIREARADRKSRRWDSDGQPKAVAKRYGRGKALAATVKAHSAELAQRADERLERRSRRLRAGS